MADAESTEDLRNPARRPTVVLVASAVAAAVVLALGLVLWLVGRSPDDPGLAADAASPTAATSPSDEQRSLPTTESTTEGTPTTSVASPPDETATSPAEPGRTGTATAEPTPVLPGAGSLDGYVTLLERATDGEHSFEHGSWRLDPCSEFSEPAYTPPELVDYLTTRREDGYEVTIGVHEDVEGARSLLALIQQRVEECGADAEYSFEGIWTETALDGMGDEAFHLHAVYDISPSGDYLVSNGIMARVANVVLLVGDGHQPAGPERPSVALPDSLHGETGAELAALMEHLGLTG